MRSDSDAVIRLLAELAMQRREPVEELAAIMTARNIRGGVRNIASLVRSGRLRLEPGPADLQLVRLEALSGYGRRPDWSLTLLTDGDGAAYPLPPLVVS